MRVHLSFPNIVSLFLDSAANDFIFFPSPYVIIQLHREAVSHKRLYVPVRNNPTAFDQDQPVLTSEKKT